MPKQKEYKVKIILNLEEIDALDDLLDLHLKGESVDRGVNREALLQIREQLDELMELVYHHLGFSSHRGDKQVVKYLM